VVNLIDNALDAVAQRPDGKVQLSAKARGAMVELVVSDNGAGIAEDERSKIFEPFFTTKAVGEGTGLGLWITFTIVQDYDGEITVHNGEAGGAEFRILLPAAASN
jgi:two-component system sensor histidine kinase HupT/HoxJ